MCTFLSNTGVSCLHLYTLSSGLGGSALICAIYPFYEASRTILLVLVSLLGLCNSIAFSTSYQIVTHFGTSNSVALTTGKGAQLGLMPESLECFCMLHGIAAVGIVDGRNALCVTASHAGIERPPKTNNTGVISRFCGQWAYCCPGRGGIAHGPKTLIHSAAAAI